MFVRSSLCFALATSFASAANPWEDMNTVTLCHPHGALATQALERAARDFERLHNGRKKAVIIPCSWGMLPELLENTTGADIVTVGSTWASELYDKGKLTSISDLMVGWRSRRGRKGDVTRDFVRYLDYTYQFPGDKKKMGSLPEWHVLPLDVGTRVLFYRKDKFKEHANLNRGPITIEEATQIGEQIREKEAAAGNQMSGLVVPYGGGTSDVMMVMTTYVMGNGSSFIGPGEQCTFESNEFRGAVSGYTSHNALNGGALPGNGSYTIAEQFAQGKVAMFAGAAWLTCCLTADSMGSVLNDSQIGYAPLPSGPTGPFTFQGGSGWALPHWVPAEKRELVWEFIEFFMEPTGEYMKELTFGSGLIPAYESVLRVEKLLSADAIELDAVALGGADMSTCLFSNPDGVGGDASHLMQGDGRVWVDYAQTPLLEMRFAAPITFDTYSFKASLQHYERDPAVWTLEAHNDGTGLWELVHQQADPKLFPLGRGSTWVGNLGKNVTGKTFRVRVLSGRGSLCGEVCQLTVEQLAFAVPLHYPQQGFFKIGRLEANGTIERLVKRITLGGQTIEESTSQACRELEAILYDPPELAHVLQSRDLTPMVLGLSVGLGGLLICVLVCAFVHNKLFAARTQEEIDRLKSNNEMAEDLAAAVACMDLDAVEYLHMLERPNRIQSAFITIIQNLREYRAYMPSSLLIANTPDTEEDVSEYTPRSSHPGSIAHSGVASQSIVSSILSRSSRSSKKEPVRMIVTALSLAKKSFSCTVINVIEFRKHTANLADKDLIALHTQILESHLKIAQQTRGVADGFTGDRLLISHGAVKQLGSHAHAACTTAVTIRETQMDVRFSIAVATGSGKVGNMGTPSMRKFTMLGNCVSWVYALERYNRHYANCGVLCEVNMANEAVAFFARKLDVLLFPKLKATAIVVSELCKKDVCEEEWMYQLEGQTDPHANWNAFASSVFSGDFATAAAKRDAARKDRTLQGRFVNDWSYEKLSRAVDEETFTPTSITFH